MKLDWSWSDNERGQVAYGRNRQYIVERHALAGHYRALQHYGRNMLKATVCDGEDEAKKQCQAWEDALCALAESIQSVGSANTTPEG